MVYLDLPEELNRLETGPIQVGDDWPGIFIRGDNACWYSFLLKQLFSELKEKKFEPADPINYMALESLMNELGSCEIKRG
jgi:hypothetical protein